MPQGRLPLPVLDLLGFLAQFLDLLVWHVDGRVVLMQPASAEAFCCTPGGRHLIYSDEDAVMRRTELPAVRQAGPSP